MKLTLNKTLTIEISTVAPVIVRDALAKSKCHNFSADKEPQRYLELRIGKLEKRAGGKNGFPEEITRDQNLKRQKFSNIYTQN